MMPYTNATVIVQPIARPSRPSVRLIALLKPTIQKKTSTSRAVTPVPGEDPHRLLVERHPELADLLPAGGKPEERGEREHRDEVCQRSFSPDEIPCGSGGSP